MKNRIINGAMVIDQRNAGAAVTPSTDSYSLDRWYYEASNASKFTFQQNAGSVTPPAGFTKYLGATVASTQSIASGSYFMLEQRIEGNNIADLGWGTANAKTVTLSFWVQSSLTGTFGGSVQNSAFNRSYPFTYTISAANTWEYKSVTIAGDTSGTWVTTNALGMVIEFGLGVGSTYSTTAGAWAAGNYNSATGATSVVSTAGATFYITGVQLEVGSSATGFEYRIYGTELMNCQRYYEIVSVPRASWTGRVVNGGTYARSGWGYAVVKRAVPTVTLTNYNRQAFPSTSPTLDNGVNSVDGSLYYMLANATSDDGFIQCSVIASSEL
jgi:hypothetical protein